MKVKSWNAWVLLSVLITLLAGGAVWFWQGKRPAMDAAVTARDPDAAELKAFAGTRMFFGHMSVGSNVISGVAASFATAGLPAPVIVETRDGVPAGHGSLSHAHMGVNGDPFGKFTDFANVLDGPLGAQVEVALLKLCYADVVAGSDVEAIFAAYSATMAELETRHPSVRFVYSTVPLSTDRGWKSTVKSWIGQNDQMGPADNVARQRYNELIRERYGSSGRLFDIAAVEATVADAPMQRNAHGQIYYVLNAALAADPGHLNELGSQLAAGELIRIVARISR